MADEPRSRRGNLQRVAGRIGGSSLTIVRLIARISIESRVISCYMQDVLRRNREYLDRDFRSRRIRCTCCITMIRISKGGGELG